MENQEKALCINIENYTGEKPIEVIQRVGEAPKAVEQLPTKVPLSISTEGVISTPFDWLEKRVDTFDHKKANVKVNREEMIIALTINEDDAYRKNTFTGRVEFTDVFKQSKVNNPREGWEPAKLGQFLRMNRSLFADREECMKLVSLLKNFTAKCKAEIQKQRDPSGSMADVYRSEVESNLPKSFTLRMSIFKGTAKQNMEVEFDHYLMDGNVMLQLVSPGANEMTEEYRDRCIDDVLDKIKGLAPDIAIMEI